MGGSTAGVAVGFGAAVMGGLRRQRARDLEVCYRWAVRRGVGLGERFMAWAWWGWHLERGGGLGMAGLTWPYHAEPAWRWRARVMRMRRRR